MLLRRITQHVKDQNWFAVFLDFLIVVVGILIAFQITNWNESRIMHEKQKIAEVRLKNDFQIIDESLENATVEHATIIRDTNTFIKSVERAEVFPEDDAAIKHALLRMRTYPNLIRNSATYEELASSGTLGLIESDALRDALAKYDEQASNRLFNLEQIRSSMQQVFVNAAEYARYKPLDINNIDLRPIDSYDIKGMAADEDFRQRLEYTLTMQTYIHMNLKGQRNEVDAVLKIMGLK